MGKQLLPILFDLSHAERQGASEGATGSAARDSSSAVPSQDTEYPPF